MNYANAFTSNSLSYNEIHSIHYGKPSLSTKETFVPGSIDDMIETVELQQKAENEKLWMKKIRENTPNKKPYVVQKFEMPPSKKDQIIKTVEKKEHQDKPQKSMSLNDELKKKENELYKKVNEIIYVRNLKQIKEAYVITGLFTENKGFIQNMKYIENKVSHTSTKYYDQNLPQILHLFDISKDSIETKFFEEIAQKYKFELMIWNAQNILNFMDKLQLVQKEDDRLKQNFSQLENIILFFYGGIFIHNLSYVMSNIKIMEDILNNYNYKPIVSDTNKLLPYPGSRNIYKNSELEDPFMEISRPFHAYYWEKINFGPSSSEIDENQYTFITNKTIGNIAYTFNRIAKVFSF